MRIAVDVIYYFDTSIGNSIKLRWPVPILRESLTCTIGSLLKKKK